MEERINEDWFKMCFIGVTATKSIINKIFPRWMELLNCNLTLECVDIPMGANVDVYRQCVNNIKTNANIKGALVTTHKIPIYSASNDLFDDLLDNARKFQEIGCIYKRNGRLIGEATDIITVKNAFKDIWFSQEYEKKNRVQICIFGCGGAGVALAHAVLSLNYSNVIKIFMVDNNPERLAKAKLTLSCYDAKSMISYNLSKGISDNDNIVSALIENAIVVNATGLGKDLPGSPITENVIFPNKGCLWEFNYRGNLMFLDIAQKHAKQYDLTIFNGFNYFVYGWLTVISRVLNIEINSNMFKFLAKEATEIYLEF